MNDDLTRLTELGVELPKTREYENHHRISDPNYCLRTANADAMRDELLDLLVAEREARVRAEKLLVELKDIPLNATAIKQAEAEVERLKARSCESCVYYSTTDDFAPDVKLCLACFPLTSCSRWAERGGGK